MAEVEARGVGEVVAGDFDFECGALLGAGLVLTSTLTNDQVAFASDGLARTNNVLVTGGPQITVCSSHPATDNKRQITLGAGSRISTTKASGAC